MRRVSSVPLTTSIADARSRRLLGIAQAADRLPPGRAIMAVVGVLALSGMADILAAPGTKFTLFYAAAIVFAAWRLGHAAGFAAVGATVLFSSLSDLWHVDFSLPPSPLAIWNMASNATGALLLVVLTASLRDTIAHEHARASTDPLTGVLNRAAFAEEVARIARARDAMLVACVDLDGFKAVNDQFGHAAGDRLLAAFATQVASALSREEAIARIGGDEFVMLIAPAPGESACERARRLHRHLREVLAREGAGVTCSIGVAAIDATSDPQTDALIAQADAAMYEAKRSGRDGVRLAGDGASLRLVARD